MDDWCLADLQVELLLLVRHTDPAGAVEFDVTEEAVLGGEVELGVAIVVEELEAQLSLSGFDPVRALAFLPGVVKPVVVDDQFAVEVEARAVVGLHLEGLRIPVADRGVGRFEDEGEVLLPLGGTEVEVGAGDAAFVDGLELGEIGKLVPDALVILVGDVAEPAFADHHFAPHHLGVAGIGADKGIAVDALGRFEADGL